MAKLVVTAAPKEPYWSCSVKARVPGTTISMRSTGRGFEGSYFLKIRYDTYKRDNEETGRNECYVEQCTYKANCGGNQAGAL